MIWSFSSNTTPATETIQVHTVILSLKKKKSREDEFRTVSFSKKKMASHMLQSGICSL